MDMQRSSGISERSCMRMVLGASMKREEGLCFPCWRTRLMPSFSNINGEMTSSCIHILKVNTDGALLTYRSPFVTIFNRAKRVSSYGSCSCED
jgi:hypothetical protein